MGSRCLMNQSVCVTHRFANNPGFATSKILREFRFFIMPDLPGIQFLVQVRLLDLPGLTMSQVWRARRCAERRLRSAQYFPGGG